MSLGDGLFKLKAGSGGPLFYSFCKSSFALVHCNARVLKIMVLCVAIDAPTVRCGASLPPTSDFLYADELSICDINPAHRTPNGMPLVKEEGLEGTDGN